MLAFAYYLLKVLICSGILYGYYLFALRNKRFHQYNRWYLLSAVVLSFAIPFLKIEFWKETVQPSAVMKVITIVGNADTYVVKNTPTVWNWNNAAAAVFVLVSLAFLLSVTVSLIKVFVLIKKNPKQLLEKVCFVFSNEPGTPFSFFKYIFWNREIDIESKTGKHILKHELAHVHEKHSSDKLFLNLVLVIGWFNPLFWLIRKELNMIHEFIADQKAIDDGDPHSLATMLLNASCPSQTFMFANSFFYSPIKRRILMLTTFNPRYSYLRRIMVLPLFTVVILFFAFRQKEKKQQHKTFASASFADTLKPGPQFPGGGSPWHRYLQRNLNLAKLEKSGVPKGTYKVTLRFNVDKEGEVSNVNALTNNGYGIELELIDLIKQGPRRLVPAKENNRTTDAIVQIDFYFTIPAGGAAVALTDEQKQSKQQYLKDLKKQEEFHQQYLQDQKKYNEEKQTYLEEKAKHGNIFAFAMQAAADTIQPAQFPGGMEAWKRYLERNTDFKAMDEHPAPEGKYTVVVDFVISKDGSISNVVAETKTGYGAEAEAIRIISKGRRWVPGKKGGELVDTPAKQTLRYTVIEKKWGIVEVVSIIIGNVEIRLQP